MSVFGQSALFRAPEYFSDAMLHKGIGSPPLGIVRRLENSEKMDKCMSSSLSMNEKQYSTSTHMKEVGLKNVESMNLAHATLLKEMDKIQKWRTNIELECENKDKKLKELMQNSESQRKVILDYQLKNESLSLQIHEEMQQRNEVLQKFVSTRDMCTALKKYFDILQEKFKYCCETRDTIDAANKERQEAIEKLANKFEDLQYENTEKIAHLKRTLTAESDKSIALMDELNKAHAEFNEKLDVVNGELHLVVLEKNNLSKDFEEEKKCLKLQVEKNAHLTEINQQLASSHDRATNQIQEMDLKLKELQSYKIEIETNYSLACNHINELKEKYAEKEQAFKNLTKLSEEKNVDFNQSIGNLQAALDDEKKKVYEEQNKSQDLMSKISEIQLEKNEFVENASRAVQELERARKTEVENLESKLNSLMEEKNAICHELLEAKNQILKNENSITLLKTQSEEDSNLILNIKKEVTVLEEELEKSVLEKKISLKQEEELKNNLLETEKMLSKIKSEKENLENSFSAIEAELNGRIQKAEDLLNSVDFSEKDMIIENMKAECNVLQNELIEKDITIESLQVEYCSLQKDLSEKDNVFENLKADYDVLQNTLNDKVITIESLQVEFSILKEDLIKKDETVGNLKLERNNIQEQLTEKDKHMEDLKVKYNILHDDLDEKDTSLESLKTKHDDLLKDVNEKGINIDTLKAECINLQKKLSEGKKSTICTQCETLQEELKDRSEKLKQSEAMEAKVRKYMEMVTQNLRESQEATSKQLYQKAVENLRLEDKISALQDKLNFGDAKIYEFNCLKEKVAEFETLVENMKKEQASEVKKLQLENESLQLKNNENKNALKNLQLDNENLRETLEKRNSDKSANEVIKIQLENENLQMKNNKNVNEAKKIQIEHENVKKSMETVKINKKEQYIQRAAMTKVYPKQSPQNKKEVFDSLLMKSKVVHSPLMRKPVLQKPVMINQNKSYKKVYELDSSGSECVDVENLKSAEQWSPKIDRRVRKPIMGSTPKQNQATPRQATTRAKRNFSDILETERPKSFVTSTPVLSIQQLKKPRLIQSPSLQSKSIEKNPSTPTMKKFFKTRVPGKDTKPFSFF